jgi:hypothetical protein
MWLVKQVSTPFTFPLSATQISSEIEIWQLTLTSTLRMTMILTCAQYYRLLGYNCFAIHRSITATACASVKKSFINCGQERVHVLSYLASNGNLNLHCNCQNSVMVKQCINYWMEHQAWSGVRQIGQQQTQHTTWLVNLTMIYQLIKHTLQLQQSPMPYTLWVL